MRVNGLYLISNREIDDKVLELFKLYEQDISDTHDVQEWPDHLLAESVKARLVYILFVGNTYTGHYPYRVALRRDAFDEIKIADNEVGDEREHFIVRLPGGHFLDAYIEAVPLVGVVPWLGFNLL